MRAPKWSNGKTLTIARRMLSIAAVAGLALASARCSNDPVEVIETYQYGGNGSGAGSIGATPNRPGIPGTTRDTTAAFSRAPALDPYPGNAPTR